MHLHSLVRRLSRRLECVAGVPLAVIKQALHMAMRARLQVLNAMQEAHAAAKVCNHI